MLQPVRIVFTGVMMGLLCNAQPTPVGVCCRTGRKTTGVPQLIVFHPSDIQKSNACMRRHTTAALAMQA